MGKDYYNILGVSKTASQEEIKKAYKKQALKWHPDRNKEPGAEEKFKEVAEAYEILSNVEKKKIYDQFGEEGLKTDGPGGPGGYGGHSFYTNIDPRDLFSQMFGDDDLSGFNFGGPGMRMRFGNFSHPDLFGFGRETKFTIDCSLEDVYQGRTKRISVPLTMLDGPSGKQVRYNKQFELKIEPGYKTGTKIRFKGQGDENQNGKSDLVFQINETPHPYFKRDGIDLIYNQKISLKQALCGCIINIPHFGNRVVKVEVNDTIGFNSTKVIQGEGMPNPKDHSKKGNLYIKFTVEMPKTLTQEQKDKLKVILI